MSGYACYDDALDPQYKEPHHVPMKIASKETLEGFGRIVLNFDDEEVEITQWPQTGSRPICTGTGRQGGVSTGDFIYEWKGDVITACNLAVTGLGDYVIGRLPADVSPTKRTHVLVREANYHPDGGQVFFPRNKNPFVALLALPGDDIKLEDFVAFYFDGSFGVQIRAGIWHQPLYPINDSEAYQGKQGAVYACVVVDTVNEFGKYLRVPLVKD